jgi:hypothetical protein
MSKWENQIHNNSEEIFFHSGLVHGQTERIPSGTKINNM